jgi:hypothetical protein
MSEEIYRSANGDRWLLIRERNVVRHEPNLSSGGRVTETDLTEFLERTGPSPENQAIRRLYCSVMRLMLVPSAVRVRARPRWQQYSGGLPWGLRREELRLDEVQWIRATAQCPTNTAP